MEEAQGPNRLLLVGLEELVGLVHHTALVQDRLHLILHAFVGALAPAQGFDQVALGTRTRALAGNGQEQGRAQVTQVIGIAVPSEVLQVVSHLVGDAEGFTVVAQDPVNLLVMGVGGYRVSDYTRVGIPLVAVLLGVVVLVLPIVWPLT